MPKYTRDSEYVKLRTALVPEAEKFANDTQGKTWRGSGRSHDQWCAAWNATFHAKMEELVKERIMTNGCLIWRPGTRWCVVCGSAIIAPTRHQTVCSDECADIRNRRRECRKKRNAKNAAANT